MQDESPEIETISLTTTRTVTICDPTGRPSLELKDDNGMVTAKPLPQNSGKRTPIRLTDLKAAVDTLASAR